MILDGKETKNKIVKELKEKISEENLVLRLDIIEIGNNEASERYIKNKKNTAKELGIICNVHNLDTEVSEEEVLDLIHKLNNDNDCNGIIVQLPIPKHLNEDKIIESINPLKDVDGFTNISIGNLVYGRKTLAPCTSRGIIRLLDEYNISLSGKNITIIGRSVYIGKSLFHLLVNRDATVTLCHSKTKNLEDHLKSSDIIITAVGKEKFITKNMINKGVTIVDVSINFDKDGKMCGDCDYENIKDLCSYITPVPGGVGPMTVASIYLNLIDAYNMQHK